MGACAIVLVLLLWAGSFFCWVSWRWSTNTWSWKIDCDWGMLHLVRDRQLYYPPLYIISHARQRELLGPRGTELDSPAARNYYGFVLPGLVTRVPSSGGWAPVFWLKLPLWLLVLLLAMAVLFCRDKPYPAGYCPKCGYNLTGNVSGRCPECGEAVASGGK